MILSHITMIHITQSFVNAFMQALAKYRQWCWHNGVTRSGNISNNINKNKNSNNISTGYTYAYTYMYTYIAVTTVTGTMNTNITLNRLPNTLLSKRYPPTDHYRNHVALTFVAMITLQHTALHLHQIKIFWNAAILFAAMTMMVSLLGRILLFQHFV